MNTDFKIKKSVPIRSIRAHPCSILIRYRLRMRAWTPAHPGGARMLVKKNPCQSVTSVLIRVLFQSVSIRYIRAHSVCYSYIPAFASASRTRSGVISFSARSRASASTCICIWRLAEMRGM
jgi:hypothetical protein